MGKYQPVGKQTITPSGIWYTPASGIWQTVWLEPVNIHHIERVDINNNFDDKEIKITFRGANNFKLPLECNVKYNDKIVGNAKGLSNEEITDGNITYYTYFAMIKHLIQILKTIELLI